MLLELISNLRCCLIGVLYPHHPTRMETSVIFKGFSYTIAVFAVTFLLVLVAVNRYRGRPKNLPPGPWGLPIVGSLLSLGANPHLTFMEMTKRYGNVFRMNLAGQQVVVVNGFQAVREALVKNASAFAGRPMMALFHKLTEGQGIVTSDFGPVWREQRRFTLQTLRNFGFGKRSFETKITEEIHHMLNAFREKGSESFHADHILEISASNVVSSLNFGRRFDYKDPQFQLLVDMIYRFSEIGTNAAAANFFPFLIKLPLPNIREMFHINDIINGFLTGIIGHHKETYDPNAKRDFIDAYLGEIARRQKECPSDDITASFTEKYLYHILNDLIFAGTETMSSTLRWAILYMIAFPDVQNKIQAELDTVLPRHQLPSIEDRSSLPYTEATLMEVQRMANITALPYPHKTTEDTELCGYNIPKDTPIYINLFSVHVDPTEWKEPEKFKPERFLDDSGMKVRNRPALMPFSAGRRACPGENLAKMELFLFFASMLHSFEFSAAPENPNPSLQKNYGISLNPSPFKICVAPR